MRQSLRKTLLWQGIGLLFYLAGMGLFLVMAVSVFLAPPQNSLANLTTSDMLLGMVSVGLLIMGRVLSWKFGGETSTMGAVTTIRSQGPNQSKLEELGYQIPPEDSGNPDSGVTSEDGTVYVQCAECGVKNEQQFEYCNNCSSQLPE